MMLSNKKYFDTVHISIGRRGGYEIQLLLVLNNIVCLNTEKLDEIYQPFHLPRIVKLYFLLVLCQQNKFVCASGFHGLRNIFAGLLTHALLVQRLV